MNWKDDQWNGSEALASRIVGGRYRIIHCKTVDGRDHFESEHQAEAGGTRWDA